MPLPPVSPGNEAYFYDRINQNVTTPSMIDQRVFKVYSVQSDGSQTLLSPYTDTSDDGTADGSTGTSKNSNLLIHPSMSLAGGFHSPGKMIIGPTNWSALSSSGISSGLKMIGQSPLGKEVDSTLVGG
ncbi:hypothetical protein FBUS_00492 [Fasciolopsis buskii]|uniref:Uncharacterized protein n=1 Tax=Fasciolopsis buskii TaxID=27845 RepID=A0A8E0VNM8_9TREM|nr:hypothetical protein FBUS_00492 [Fasciolopsis buski]